MIASILLITIIKGIFDFDNKSKILISKSFSPVSSTNINAISVFFITSKDFFILSSPSSPSSSIPAVSISTTGPFVIISIVLYTGSVVYAAK